MVSVLYRPANDGVRRCRTLPEPPNEFLSRCRRLSDPPNASPGGTQRCPTVRTKAPASSQRGPTLRTTNPAGAEGGPTLRTTAFVSRKLRPTSRTIDFHVSAPPRGWIADATDAPAVRTHLHPAEGTSPTCEHRTSLRRCESDSRFSSHCESHSHLSRRRLRVPRMADRVPGDAFHDFAPAALRVTAATNVLVFYEQGIPSFGTPPALHQPGCAAAAASPKRNETIHVRMSAPLAPGAGGGPRREETQCKPGPSARHPPRTSRTSPT
jgi:hypothetical protein